MKYTTKSLIIQVAPVRLHALVVFSFLLLALSGRTPEASAGWITNPPLLLSLPQTGRGRRQRSPCGHHSWPGDWWQVCQRGQLPLLRSLLLGMLAWRHGGRGAFCAVVPWLLWLWQEAGSFWPWLLSQPEWRLLGWLLWQGQRLLLFWLMADGAREALMDRLAPAKEALTPGGISMWGMGALLQEEKSPSVTVTEDEGYYTATLQGTFTLRVQKDDPFRQRFLILFLGLLDVPGQTRKSRRTRDGRTPFVRQEEMAAWFAVPGPDISRWRKYWLQADWRRLLSLRTQDILTLELQQRIVQTLARFPWWNDEAVYRHLQSQGVAVSQSQVRQAAQESGWSLLRQELQRRYHLTAEGIRFKDEDLVGQLLAQIEALLSKLEAGAGMTAEERLDLADLQALCAEGGIVPAPPMKALPWLMRVERVVFGHWEEVMDGTVRCTYCGSTHVTRKSRKGRLKKYYDPEGNLQTVEVYRYYCRNPLCDKKTFTNLPPGLVPYSRYRTEVHLLGVQMYAWGYSTYRRTGQALGVASMTVYRWVSAWGYELLPVAALFGVVKSSGVVGIDEKYVLVPKNDKPESDMRRWMYVYFAVDVYTYDLLHIAIYPYNNKESAQAFLLALRAKGYHPRVIVTDLRVDYGPLIAKVFPNAQHHQCIFHGLQNVQDYFQEVYGAGYTETHPQAEALKQKIYHIFDAKTKRTAQKRYDKVLALREHYVQQTPAAMVIFDFLERHWPTLVNGIESDLIPRTNNAVELVIRRFDQHYQNFCGFDTIETAQLFLGVFEKIYRFTPFSQDAQPRIRGKCPLELAGYDVSQVPMAALCAGLSVAWPLEVTQNFVPNS